MVVEIAARPDEWKLRDTGKSSREIGTVLCRALGIKDENVLRIVLICDPHRGAEIDVTVLVPEGTDWVREIKHYEVREREEVVNDGEI